jgi:hypothetical protein
MPSNEELYTNACRALYQYARQRGSIYNHPNRNESDFTETVIILRSGISELGRYDIREQRLITEQGA